jgi:hypothetical protein
MINYLTCRHTTRLLSDRQERSLSCFEWLCLEVHLLGCAPCCRFDRAIRWLHRALPGAPTDARLADAARERIRHTLELVVREGEGQ